MVKLHPTNLLMFIWQRRRERRIGVQKSGNRAGVYIQNLKGKIKEPEGNLEEANGKQKEPEEEEENPERGKPREDGAENPGNKGILFSLDFN